MRNMRKRKGRQERRQGEVREEMMGEMMGDKGRGEETWEERARYERSGEMRERMGRKGDMGHEPPIHIHICLTEWLCGCKMMQSTCWCVSVGLDTWILHRSSPIFWRRPLKTTLCVCVCVFTHSSRSHSEFQNHKFHFKNTFCHCWPNVILSRAIPTIQYLIACFYM